MSRFIKIYRNNKTGQRIAEVYDVSFISDRNHGLGWFRLHIRHFSIKILLKWADKIYVPDYDVAMDLVKYYFYPRQKIVIDRTILSTHKS